MEVPTRYGWNNLFPAEHAGYSTRLGFHPALNTQLVVPTATGNREVLTVIKSLDEFGL